MPVGGGGALFESAIEHAVLLSPSIPVSVLGEELTQLSPIGVIDTEQIRRRVVSAPPSAARWIVVDEPLDFDFSRSVEPLVWLQASEVNFDVDRSWDAPCLFGTQSFADGGGASEWLAIHRETGEILGLDVEREPAVVVYNSDIEEFVETFHLFDETVRYGGTIDKAFSAKLNAIDPAFARSEWKQLADYLLSKNYIAKSEATH